MKLPHINASSEAMWKWFKVPGFQGTEAELKLLTRLDLVKLGTAKDLGEETALIAKEYFRDFRGCRDANGVDIPNTIELRAEMLKDVLFGVFVSNKLSEIADWRAEGKDGSGSGS
jgi:hypothetical protein